jgi:L-alanine-DL-glutamate epimerase-like enolase superfamily enzyme
MGWTLDYAKRMLPLLEPFNLRWLEEPVIPDDIQGYAQLKAYGRVPIAGGEHEFTLFGAHDLLQARAAEFADGGTLPDCGCGGGERAVLVHLRWRAESNRRPHRSG